MPGERASLAEVAVEIGASALEDDRRVVDVHHDSRAVVPGTIFVAIRGAGVDGHDFGSEAQARGAIAVIVERSVGLSVPELIVPDSRAALAIAAATVHGFPSRRLGVIGVTGTNGKTTVTSMIGSICAGSGKPTGVIGTLGAHIGEAGYSIDRTTPESSDLQRILRGMADGGAVLAAIEVSSHALTLNRVDATRFRIGAFTNLSQDHLDFHGDMESYFAAKRGLFSKDRTDLAVVFTDDPFGKRLAASTDLALVTVGLSDDADVAATSIAADSSGSLFTLRAGGDEARVRIPIRGRFNVANAIVAAACSLESGIGFDDVCSGLESLAQIPGRFQVVPGSWPFQVIVDYAHSPDAVATVIEDARSVTRGHVVVVLGAGGDRDVAKRAMMGAAAGTADLAVLTSDNPRSEDPAAIVAALERGVPGSSRITVELDRRSAIRRALEECQPQDVLLILGKGHEQGQEFALGRIEPFDDRTVAQEEWAVRMPGGVE